MVRPGLEEDAVAGAYDLDGTAATLAQPDALVTQTVGPFGWVCHAVSPPGVKCTLLADSCDWPIGAATVSMKFGERRRRRKKNADAPLKAHDASRLAHIVLDT